MISISYFDLFIQTCTFPSVSLVLATSGTFCHLYSGDNLEERLLVWREDWLDLLWFWQKLIARETENFQCRQTEDKVWYFRQEIIVEQDDLHPGVPAQGGWYKDEKIIPDKQSLFFYLNVNVKWWEIVFCLFLS